MSNIRPVYVPAHKRNRFHGAFTGGFSAGYFNTVGSKGGWKPREDVREEQSTQDFMDDQDHNEWGGPTSVKRDFVAHDTEQKKEIAPFEWIQPPPNVGTRLLRVLGWREGSTAYVPTEDGKTGEKASTVEETVLSLKRLKRIQLQQTRVRIPPPKLDAGGLGYDVYRDAPEFQAHREKRRREAQKRSREATAEGANAYRLSDLQDDDPCPKDTRSASNIDNDDPYLSYETTQDFVGTKTVSGFALQEDADDVYDDKPLPKGSSLHTHVDKEQYDTVVFEHDSDDEEGNKNEHTVGGILSSWATGDSTKSVGLDRGVTSDGQPPLSGFCLGGATTLVESKRYPGPELPTNYVLKKHLFRDDEHPENFAQMAKQEKVEQKRHQAFERMTNPMAGGAFSGLAAAMKSRFTAAVPTTTENCEPTPVGLHRPVKVAAPRDTPLGDDTKKSDREVKIERTFLLFYPDPLVCKRLGVTPPTHSKKRVPDQKRTAESTFFEKEVLKQAAEAKPLNSAAHSEKEYILNGDVETGLKATDERPAIEVYKSIYEPKSESEPDDDEDVNNLLQSEALVKTQDSQAIVPVKAHSVVLRAEQHGNAKDEDIESDSESERRQKKRKRRKREDKKRRRKRSPSLSSSDTDLDAASSDDEDRRRQRKYKKHRKRKDEKKKRKKHKSSRRREE